MVSLPLDRKTPDGKKNFVSSILVIGLGLAIFLFLFGVLLFHARRYMPFLSDDALISLRYAQRLVQGHGLTWTDGRPVEGFSNFLWVLLNAFLGFWGIDLVSASRILGYICMGGAIVGLFAAFPPRGWRGALPVLMGGGFLVLSAPVAIWTIGGLEQPLILLLLTWAIIFGFKVMDEEQPRLDSIFLLGLCLGLLLLTRPDSLIFLVTFAGVIFLVRGRNKQALKLTAALLVLPAILFFGQLFFRLAYYGDWVPNTAYAKIVPSFKHLVLGLRYVFEGLASFSPFLELGILAGILGIFHRHQVKRIILLAALICSWTVYLILIGGDIFPGWRQLIPVIPAIAFLLMTGTDWLLQDRRKSHRTTLPFFAELLALTAILAVIFAMYFKNQSMNDQNRSTYQGMWVWDGERIGEMLKKGFGKYQPLLAVDTAGSLPYWSELPSLDMLGLNDYYIARHPPALMGAGPIGHELGNGQYVFDRKPDLIMFCSPWGWRNACFQSGIQMQQMPEFFEAYTFSQFDYMENVPVGIWIRKQSPKIGILERENLIEIPAYLINGNPSTLIDHDETGEFYVQAAADASVLSQPITLPAGNWEVEVISNSGANIEILDSNNQTLAHGWSADHFRYSTDFETIITVALHSSQAATANVYKILLRRIGS
jgi:arabinofuranosyltransferase